MGKVVGYAPYVGIVTILLNDYPYVKYAVLVIMCLLVIVAKDP